MKKRNKIAISIGMFLMLCSIGIIKVNPLESIFLIIISILLIFNKEVLSFLFKKINLKGITEKNISMIFYIFLFICFVITSSIASRINQTNYNLESEKNNNINNYNENLTTNSNTSETTDNYANLSLLNSKAQENFKKALSECNIKSSKVTELSKEPDWSNGKKYSFKYKNDLLWLYLNDDNTISSINLNIGGLHIYDEKLESLNYENYYISNSDAKTIKEMAEIKVNNLLKYPDSVKYKWSSYQRTNNYFIIAGSISANNNLGMKVENNIEIEFENTNEFKIIFVGIDGKTYEGEKIVPNINRKERENTDTSTNENITLSDGIVGNYGKYDTMDGKQYLRFYIPTGKYKVEALIKNSMFYIESIAIHEEDGYDTPSTYDTISFKNKGETKDIEIIDGQCISLVLGTKIKLTKE